MYLIDQMHTHIQVLETNRSTLYISAFES